MKSKEFTSNDEACSIENVRNVLVSSFQGMKIEGVNYEFVSKERIRRPSFGFIHTIIKLCVLHGTSNFKLLYDESELDAKFLVNRKDKILFLFKMINFISIADDEPLYLFISPVKVLCGKDVKKTRWFLLRLAHYISRTDDVMPEKLEEVNQKDLKELYRKAVHTRITFSQFQVAIRKRKEKKHANLISHDSDIPIKHEVPDESASKSKKNEYTKKQSFLVPSKVEKNADTKAIRKEGNSRIAAVCTPVNPNTSRVFQDSGENDINGVRSTKVDQVRQDDSAIFMKKVNKIKIVNGIKHTEEIFIVDETIHHRMEESQHENEKKSNTKDIRELESELRKKLNKVKQKELKLKQQVELTNAKEELLKVHEERVKKLAEKLRRQQEKIKEEERRNSSELDKMRLKLAENAVGSFQKRPLEYFDSKNIEFGDDLLRKACENPTITDLRLALERKQRTLTKRAERIAKAEKELHSKLEDLNSVQQAAVIAKSDTKSPKSSILSNSKEQVEQGQWQNLQNLLITSFAEDVPEINESAHKQIQLEFINSSLSYIEEEEQ